MRSRYYRIVKIPCVKGGGGGRQDEEEEEEEEEEPA